MQEKNELNDIILNKGKTTAQNKKVILAVATLGVVLIIVVMLMNTLNSGGTDNLPQATLPPQPQATTDVGNEPLFEDADIVEEDSNEEDDLNAIAQKLKRESQLQDEIEEVEVIPEPETVIQQAPKKVKKVVQQAPKKAPKRAKKAVGSTDSYYVQVGSFSKYEPNKKFIKSITDRGFNYEFHKVTVKGKSVNKVLVGPFNSDKSAKEARRVIRKSIEAGAFIYRMK